MATSTDFAARKHRAIVAGLEYIRTLGHSLFRNETLWARHGADILIPFFVPRRGGTAAERHALGVATELAGVWRERAEARRRVDQLRTAEPAELLGLMQGCYSLECLGMPLPALRQQLAERCAAYGAVDFLKYDPAAGPPSARARETCACGAAVAAGASHCARCKRAAVPMSKFDVWLEALVWTFHGCRMNIGLGACFFDVLRGLAGAFAELYPRRAALGEKDRHYLTYALTHVIFALNNFDERALPPALFPPSVVGFLREQMGAAAADGDADLLGEVLDCLKCLGQADGATAAAEAHLIATQLDDGGWASKGETELFSRYHATLVAVAALMDHSYAARGSCFAAAATVLPRWFLRPPPREEAAAAADGDDAALLCSVDHRHEGARERAAWALREAEGVSAQWPLPPAHREVVALLPVMRRMEVREGVLRHKKAQRGGALRRQLEAQATARFVESPALHHHAVADPLARRPRRRASVGGGSGVAPAAAATPARSGSAPHELAPRSDSLLPGTWHAFRRLLSEESKPELLMPLSRPRRLPRGASEGVLVR